MGDQTLPGSRAFVTGMLRDDGTVRAEEVYRVGELLGYTTHQIRLAFARLVHEGLFEQVGRGRQAVLRATAQHATLHGSDVEWLALAYRQDQGRAPWDGRWHLVSFSLDEERRAARNELRDLLTALSAAPISGGLYAHAHDWGADVRSLAVRLGIEGDVTLATATGLDVGGVTAPNRLARQLWPLDTISHGYATFVRTHGRALRRHSDSIEQLAYGMTLVADFERCVRADPLLPPELLPSRWPGRRARAILLEFASVLADAREHVGVPAMFGRYDLVGREN